MRKFLAAMVVQPRRSERKRLAWDLDVDADLRNDLPALCVDSRRSLPS